MTADDSEIELADVSPEVWLTTNFAIGLSEYPYRLQMLVLGFLVSGISTNRLIMISYVKLTRAEALLVSDSALGGG